MALPLPSVKESGVSAFATPPGAEQQSNQEQDNSSDQPTDEQKSNSEDNEEKAEPNSDQKSENS